MHKPGYKHVARLVRKMQESIQEMSSDRMNSLLSRFIQKLQGRMVQKCCTIFTRPPFPLWRVGGGSRFETKFSCTHCIAVCILSCKSNAALVKEVKEHSKTLDKLCISPLSSNLSPEYMFCTNPLSL